MFLKTNLDLPSKKPLELPVWELDPFRYAYTTHFNETWVDIEALQELLRGIRQHFSKFSEVSENDLEKAQLGLGHRYSRAKVKFNIHKVDNMVIQSIALLDQLDKDVNTFSMRARWVPLCWKRK